MIKVHDWLAQTGVEGALTTIVKRAGPKNKVVARHDMVIREAGSSMARMWYSYYGDCHGILVRRGEGRYTM